MLTTVLATEEEESSSFLVSPDVGLMIWTLVVFVIAMYILSKVAFPRIAEALDKRQKAKIILPVVNEDASGMGDMFARAGVAAE